MPRRSRSRSPLHRRSSPDRSHHRDHDRVRDRERDRDRDREKYRKDRRSRSRSRERYRGRERAPSREKRRSTDVAPATSTRKPLTEADFEGKTPDEIELMKTMGFCGFDTTKNKKVDGNDVSGANVQKKRRFRQYMNRKGGFNRPLDAIA